ncbi:protein kinase [Actinomadura geliboluensis]|uniref:protein kinase n=1 Tax=Actinomadura geliboluensis TaxID=882440 RepID=UPI00371899E9
MSDLPAPDGLAEVLHPHTGALVSVERTERGFSSDLTALVTGEKGEWFVKAVRNRPGGRRESLVREGLINPHVHPVSPAVHWRSESREWLALGFEAVDGRHADFAPGSSDLPAVVDVLTRIGALPLPDIAADWHETRWDRYTDRPDLFQGDALLYTDIHPSNILIGHRVWAVDWAWPTRGAAFIDPALLVLQLVASGHGPEQAEGWVSDCPAWKGGDPAAIDAFADANASMYTTLADRRPAATWFAAMASAARTWSAYRW